MADSDTLILVDEQDREIGFMPKREAHLGKGTLHRAFSVLVFDHSGRLLLQQRVKDKMLWGGYWSNTVCSHPRKGEELLAAAHRRLQEELGMESPDLKEAFTFIYQVPFAEIGSEHEFLHVFVGHSVQPPQPNPREVAAVRYITQEELTRELDEKAEAYTPWFKMIWERVQKSGLV